MAAQKVLFGAAVTLRARSEDMSSFEDCEHNVDTLTLEVVGQNWSSEVVSLCLEDCELGRVASS